MKSLLEAGVHFGHQTQRWDPRMRTYIFTERNGIHIIDLQQTVQHLTRACDFVRDLVASGKNVLFTGTKRQAQESIESEACLLVPVKRTFFPLATKSRTKSQALVRC